MEHLKRHVSVAFDVAVSIAFAYLAKRYLGIDPVTYLTGSALAIGAYARYDIKRYLGK